MSDLSPQARALIDAAGNGDNPTAGDRARIKRAVVASVSGGAALASATAASSTAAAATGVSAAAIAKVVAVVAVVGAVGTTAVLQPWQPPEDASAPSSPAGVVNSAHPVSNAEDNGVLALSETPLLETAPSEAALPETALPETALGEAALGEAALGEAALGEAALPETALRDTAPAESTPTEIAVREPRPESGNRVAPREVSAPPATIEAELQASQPVTPAEPESPRSTLGDQVELLRAAYAAQRAGRAIEADRLLDDHQSRYPTSPLAAERAVTRILVLCDLGRTTQAQARARQFAARNSSSPLLSRIRSSCAGRDLP